MRDVDGIMYDLGMSSLQLADAARGFAFSGTGELDMRLDPTSDAASAAQLLATAREGETRTSSANSATSATRGASRVRSSNGASARRCGPPRISSRRCSRAQRQAARKRRSAIHPATRTFLALRMAVNSRSRAASSTASQTRCAASGPAAASSVISFHSGEDRVVKHQFAAWRRAGEAEVLTRKPVSPTQTEVAANLRARSAKLRGGGAHRSAAAGERTDMAAARHPNKIETTGRLRRCRREPRAAAHRPRGAPHQRADRPAHRIDPAPSSWCWRMSA